ncbi:MAG: HAMP domain-containing histidine kinase [Actinomycetota bacterium]|nr:HAMP domain-containing histidine kinase [Actinomycetota bacterium]
MFAIFVDLVVLAVGALLVFALDRSSWLRIAVSEGDLALILISVGAACAAMTAILAGVVDRLSMDRRAAWISAAFALYGVVWVPAATLSGSFGRTGASMDATRFAAHLGTVVLLGVAVLGPRRRPWARPVVILTAGLLWVAVVAALAWVAPDTAQLIAGNAMVRASVGLVAVAIGAALVVVGLMARSRPVARVGTAFAALAAAGVYRVVESQPGMSLSFAGVQLLALMLALWGLVELTGRTLGAVRDTETTLTDELRRARSGLAMAAERDDELRSRLASLAEVAELLAEPPGEESEEIQGLRKAVRAELVRLESMLVDEQAGTSHQAVAYPVAPMVHDLVALRSCAGMDIRCDVGCSPWADGSPTVLKQVLSNVLANCARHAPGSPVRVQVGLRRDRIRLRVSDFGLGVPAGLEQAVFERGTCNQAAGGLGLGLYICRELLEAEGGKIEIRPPSSVRAGCTVVVEVPKAKSVGSRGATVARAG